MAMCGLAACEDLEAAVEFENQTGESVWVGVNAYAPRGFRVPDELWTRIQAGATSEIWSGGGCMEVGEVVVATEPDQAAVIDVRPVDDPDSTLCSNDVWRWSGIGDHE